MTLAEGVLREGVGATVSLAELRDRDGVDDFTALFSESAARAVVAVDGEDAQAFALLCAEQGQQVIRLGDTGGTDLHVDGLFRLSTETLREANTGVIEAALG